MRLNRTRIHNVYQYLGGIPAGTLFRVSYEVTLDPEISRVGFVDNPIAGSTILPKIIGPVTRFNAEGKWDVKRDQPKERRYVRTVLWSWKQWEGRDKVEKEDFRDIYRDCFRRDLIEPPAAELTILMEGGRRFLVSESLTNDGQDVERTKHIINVFLELFGACDIVDENLVSLPAAIVRKVHWRMLPAGEHPFERIEKQIRATHGSRSPGDLRFILDRQTTIYSHEPSTIHVGQGGFQDYVAYEFANRGIIVLECIRRDNALYAFGRNWKAVSKLTKAEVIRGSHHLARIIHSQDWKQRLEQLLRNANTG